MLRIWAIQKMNRTGIWDRKFYLISIHTQLLRLTPESTKYLEEKYGNKVLTIKADVANATSIQQLAEQTKDVDIVVNNAGVGPPYPTLGNDEEKDFAYNLEVNAFGLLRIANTLAKTLEKNKGALVQLNSIASIKTSHNFLPILPRKRPPIPLPRV
tara:strand:- start:15000 stop:15467 length:468 start_codon:yes stop_codon:yes gene_type:complete